MKLRWGFDLQKTGLSPNQSNASPLKYFVRLDQTSVSVGARLCAFVCVVRACACVYVRVIERRWEGCIKTRHEALSALRLFLSLKGVAVKC
jgi:hypothetical protein